MSLVDCPECGNSISDKAICCSSCGYPFAFQDRNLDPYSKSYFDNAFTCKLILETGFSFQNFFATIMEKANPTDFHRSATWGKKGDFKCDGYLDSKKEVFAVYAPHEMTESKFVAKLNSDFTGALKYWPNYIEAWTFVHNSREGLGPVQNQVLLELQANNDIKIKHWGSERLRREMWKLRLEELSSLFGSVPSRIEIANVRFEKLADILNLMPRMNHVASEPINPVPAEKVKINQLSDSAVTLLRAGMEGTRQLEKFFQNHFDKALGDEIAENFHQEYMHLQLQGLSPDDIFAELLGKIRKYSDKTTANEAAVLAILAFFFEQCDIFEGS